MDLFSQLKLILWKNFMLKRRQKIRVLIEILWPLFLFVILVLVRNGTSLTTHMHPCHYDRKAMPSMGLLPFVQSLICTMNNTCHMTLAEDEGDSDSFSQARVTTLLGSFENILRSNVERNELSRFIKAFKIFTNLTDRSRNNTNSARVNIARLLDSPQSLVSYLQTLSLPISVPNTAGLLSLHINVAALISLLSTKKVSSTITWPMIVSAFITASSLSHDQAITLFYDICMTGEINSVIISIIPLMTNFITSSMCSLPRPQLMAIADLLQSQFNRSKVIGQLSNNIYNMTGEHLSTDAQFIQTLSSVIKDVMNLTEFRSFARVLTESSEDFRGENSLGLMGVLGQLFCGRNLFNFNQTGSDSSSSQLFRGRFQSSVESDNNETLEDSNMTPHCNELVQRMQSNSMGRIFWRQLKPLIRGRIAYAPDIPVIRKVIEKANSTFHQLSNVLNRLDSWTSLQINLTQILEKFLPDSSQLVVMKEYGDLTNNRNRLLYNLINRDVLNDVLGNLTSGINSFRQYLQCFRIDRFVGYKDETSIELDSLKYIKNDTHLAAIIFDLDPNLVTDELPTYVRYKIRMNADRVDSTRKIMDTLWVAGPRDRPTQDLKYITYGFSYVQDMVDEAIISIQTGRPDKSGVVVQQFPYPCYIKDMFTRALSRTLPMFMTLSWILTVAMIVKGIVYEKEQRLKETMKMMGLSNMVHWISWFISSLDILLITSLLFLLVVKGGRILEHSDPSVIFVILVSFLISTTNLSFLISVLFSRANLAAVCAGFIYYITYLPYPNLAIQEENLAASWKLFSCLFSNVAFGFTCSYMSKYELQGVGLQWSNIWQSPMAGDTFNVAKCVAMMWLDSLVYGLLTWYIGSIHAGRYGLSKPWYFPFIRSYWFPPKEIPSNLPLSDLQPQNIGEDFEKEPSGFKLGVAIKNLRKAFGKKTVAVDNLSLNFYEGQITSFLGHNGAGKTTTMSILTGLYPPSEGTAYIYGDDILTRMSHIRASLGICPQHNVLFDRLTVEEHLWFYARLKGAQKDQVVAEMEKILRDTLLVSKRADLVKNLSGGMKRKLSVAIAFVGNSRTVILDEPTAGVDPSARRSIWDLLLKFKQERTVILTTHHMDEADILGDRIAIISHGQLRCCGSSLFLKNRFGSGYCLTLVRTDPHGSEDQYSTKGHKNAENGEVAAFQKPIVQPDSEDVDHSKGESKTLQKDLVETQEEPTKGEENIQAANANSFHVEEGSKLTSFIMTYIPQAKVKEDLGVQVSYQIPASNKSGIIDLLRSLEGNYTNLGISSYGISDSTLEEVFLKVADSNEGERNNKSLIPTKGNYSPTALTKIQEHIFPKQDRLLTENDDEDVEGEVVTQVYSQSLNRVTGKLLIAKQFAALIVKRFHHVRRSKKGFISEVILPAGFICLAMVFAVTLPKVSDEPPLELHPWIYQPQSGDPHLSMFFSNEAQDSSIYTSYEKLLNSGVGVGTRCMNATVYTIKGYPCMTGVTESLPPSDVKPSNLSSAQCSCSSGFQTCPANDIEDENLKRSRRRLLPTTDYLYNMTSLNISDWLMRTTFDFTRYRYGGISSGGKHRSLLNASQIKDWFNVLVKAANNDSDISNDERRLFTDFENLTQAFRVTDSAKVWFNNKGWAALPAYMNVLSNMVLRAHLPPDKDPLRYGITTINHPMNFTFGQYNARAESKGVRDLAVATCVIFAMSFIPASFVLYLIGERVSNSKHLQLVSGVNPTVYWLATYAWDMINYLIPATLCMFIFLSFGQESYVSSTNAPCVVALLFLYGWSITPMMYPFSRVFATPSYAYVILSCANVFLGLVSTMTTFMIELLEEEDEELKDVNKILRKVFLILPHYCLGRGLMDLSTNQLISDTLSKFGEIHEFNPFDWKIVGRNLFSMFFLGIVFFMLNILIEYRFFLPSRQKRLNMSVLEYEDEDVTKERERVMSGLASLDILRVEELTAMYRSKFGTRQNRAVDGLCFAVPRGQCFGLLGINGAGKTTTFKMLTGHIKPSTGNAWINGHSLLRDLTQLRQDIGYCPQFDALSPLVTGREHLYFYSRLRGIPEKDIPQLTEWTLQMLGLQRYADVLSGNYSGGNKRKLSTSIALIGCPPVIFLDEPTAGMDPAAKRALWSCINSVIKDGCSVILTSHSMTECEALCGRLGIMVNGRFQCLGSPQHLKNRFGNGYMIVIRVSSPHPTSNLTNNDNLQKVMTFMSRTFPDAVLFDHHNNTIQYELRMSKTCLSQVFSVLEGMRDSLPVDDYSLSQTTLDQVFINFANQQANLEDLEDNKSRKRSNASSSNRYKNLENVYDVNATENAPDDIFTRGSVRSLRSNNTEMTTIEM